MEINELPFDVMHRFAAGTDHVVMGFDIAVYAHSRRMRSDLSQQPTLNKKPQVVVDRGQRNRWNSTPHPGVNGFRGMVPMRSDRSLVDHLTLMSDRQTVLRSQVTELLMGETHDYRIRMIIEQREPSQARNISVESGPV